MEIKIKNTTNKIHIPTEIVDEIVIHNKNKDQNDICFVKNQIILKPGGDQEFNFFDIKEINKVKFTTFSGIIATDDLGKEFKITFHKPSV